MNLRERFLRHRKDTRWIIVGLSALLALLSAIFYLILRGRDLPASLVTNRLLLFILLYIDVVLILAILFVLLRNIVKLLLERHNRILGSKFRTKLVATYIGLTLVPVLLLFAFASNLLQGSIDRWFTTPVKEVLDQGYAVAQAMNQRIEDTTLRDAGHALRAVEALDAKEHPQLGRHLQALLTDLHLDVLAVYEDTDLVHGAVNPQSGLGDLPEAGKSFLLEAVREGHAVRVQTPSGVPGRLVLAATAGRKGSGPRTVVVAGTLIERAVAAQSEQLIQAYQGFRQLEVQKSELKASHLLTFLMVTLLILLASSWTGLYLARRVTVPIQALAEGTRRISLGDLGTRVEVAADDELGVLVESFNRMTAELQRNKEMLESGNRELVAANQRLAEERALIAAVLESVAAGVVSLDAEGRIFTCNGAALAMLRQSEDEVLGRTPAEAWSDPERGKLRALAEAPGAERSRDEVRLLLGGEWKTFEVKASTLRDASGRPAGRVVVLEDLTELIKAQELAAWSEAARRIAHEIKNPLTPIKLSAERLLKKQRAGDPHLGEAIEEGVETIVREVETMKRMVDEFSRFARMPRPQPEEVEVGRLLDEVLQLYRGLKPGVEMAAQVEPGAERFQLDREQIRRALINLLDNALEATDAPGRVELVARPHPGALEIRVADTGRGIPAGARPKLFLPHFSTKGRGTGLGLAIVHRIVSDHRGTIRVENNPPQGTVFSIELPAP